MSCSHGNHPKGCDICEALDEAYKRGYADASIAALASAPQTSAGLASKEALIMKLSEGQVGDAGEAIRLAALFERFAIDHEPYGWPAIQQHRLSHAAALLRAQAATVAGLQQDIARMNRDVDLRIQQALSNGQAARAAEQRAEAAIAVLRDIDAHGYTTGGDYEMVRAALAGAAAEGA